MRSVVGAQLPTVLSRKMLDFCIMTVQVTHPLSLEVGCSVVHVLYLFSITLCLYVVLIGLDDAQNGNGDNTRSAPDCVAEKW